MKHMNVYCLILLTVLLSACGKDNYDAPQSQLTGRLVYQGEAIPVRYNDIVFELFEPGWQTNTPITVNVDQDGSFAALLFDADYKALFQSNRGPYIAPSDSVHISVKGNTTADIEVLPYYMLRNPSFSVTNREVTATLNIEQIITDERARDIEHVTLYLGKTLFTDGRTAVANTGINGADIVSPNNVSLVAAVPDLSPAQGYIFARIGLKIAGLEDMIFTPVQRLDL